MNGTKTMNKAYRQISSQKALVAVILLSVLLAALKGSQFLSVTNVSELFNRWVVYGIIGIGCTMTIIAGGVDLSVGGVMCLGGIIALQLQSTLPTAVGIAAAMLVGALVGFVNGYLVVHQKTEAFIITIGMGILLRGVNLTLTNGRPVPGKDMAFFEFGNARLFGFLPYIVIIAVALVFGAQMLMSRTSFGRNLYAIGGDYNVAVYSGIKAERQKWTAFIISGMTAALGGVLLSARINSASATYGDTTALIVNCAAVVGGTSMLGGVGSIQKATIGIFLFGLIENSLNLLAFGSYTQMAITGLLIVLIIGSDLHAIKRLREKV